MGTCDLTLRAPSHRANVKGIDINAQMLEIFTLFIVALVAAAVSGTEGFGSALVLLPVLVITVGVTQAVPVLTIAQFIGNLSRAVIGFSHIRWRPVGLFLVGATPLSVLGAVSFVRLPKGMVTRAAGAAILVFVALRFFGLLKIKPGPKVLLAGGAVVGFLSGLVGSEGPLGAAVFLSIGFTPVAYIASEATTALAMHGVKTVVYQHYMALDRELWYLAALIGIAMIFGTWLSKRAIERISRRRLFSGSWPFCWSPSPVTRSCMGSAPRQLAGIHRQANEICPRRDDRAMY